jgi:membrane-bound ClpP family serine protease
MSTVEPPTPPTPPTSPTPSTPPTEPTSPTPLQAPPRAAVAVRPKNGLGVASLVIGVASLVAAVSFTLFPLALVAGLVGVILGVIALARRGTSGATNTGQTSAGVICSFLALLIAVVFAVRVGTWVARNTDVFTRFDRCIAQAGNRIDVSACIARLATDVRP